jgi:Co/Zn/Cd efflux system component
MCATSCGGKTPRSTRPRSILKTIHPLTSEPTSPTPHDLGHAVQPRRDLDVAQPIGGVEHKLGALHDLVRERVARRPTLELDTLLSAQDDLGRAASQVLVFVASGSVALLADLIHNFGDASTAIPLGVAFALRSARAERWAGLAVVLVIFASACVAGYEAVDRLIDPQEVEARGALAVAGALGFAGNWVAAIIRSPAGHRLGSPALVADGAHARADAYVSLAVVASAGAVASGLQVADPLIGLGITLVILRITWDSWRTLRAHVH